MSNISHILFDCDGVLVDTEYIAAIEMCKALEAAGVKIDKDHYLRVHSGTTFSGILEHYFGDSLPQSEKTELMEKVEAQVAARVQAVPGIPALLADLIINKSVVSNSSIATVQQALKITGMSRFFSGRIFSSEQVQRAKPAPDLYLFTISSLGLRAEEILVIEDSRTGVQAAIAAGLSVVGFTGASHILPGHAEELLALGALQTAAKAVDLRAILKNYLP